MTDRRAWELACDVAMNWTPQNPQRLTVLVANAILAAIREEARESRYDVSTDPSLRGPARNGGQ